MLPPRLQLQERRQRRRPPVLWALVLAAASRRGAALSAPPSAPSSPAAVLEVVDALVIGGGVTGLTAAYYARAGGARTLLVDGASRLGGVIDTRTRTAPAYLWEDGPHTFQSSATALRRLAADLGLDVVASDPKLPRHVLGTDGAGDRLYALPQDLPRLLSFPGLLSAAAGLLLRPIAASDDADETVAAFVSRVLGAEVLDKVVEPFVATVYTGDPAALSLASVFPFLGELAAAADGTPGGLLHCYVRAKRLAADRAAAASKGVDWTQVDAGARLRPSRQDYGTLPDVPKGASLSFAGGLRALPDAARAALGDDACRLGWTAVSVRPADVPGDLFDVTFDTPDAPRTVRAHTVVVATPAAAAAALLAPLAPAAAGLAEIRAPPVAAVTLAYPRSALRPTEATASDDEEGGGSGGLNSFGVLLPRSAGLETLGFQFVSALFPSRAAGTRQVLLSYYGGARCDADLDGLTDEDIVARVHADARRVLLAPDAPAPTAADDDDDDDDGPRVLSVRRWPAGIPQYDVGHAALLADVRAGLPRTPRGGVLLTGAAAGGGVALGACAAAGRECAEAALAACRYRAAAAAARERQ